MTRNRQSTRYRRDNNAEVNLIEVGIARPGSRISRLVTVSLAAVFFALLALACSGEEGRPTDVSRFSAKVDHPVVPSSRRLVGLAKGDLCRPLDEGVEGSGAPARPTARRV